MPKENKYIRFTEVDFMNDAYFQEGVKRPDGEAGLYWQQWTETHPDRRIYVEKARDILGHIAFADHRPDDRRAQDSLDRVLARLEEREGAPSPGADEVRQRGRVIQGGWWKWAAVLILVIGAGSVWYALRGPKMKVDSTDYGMTRTIYLADSSAITLNGHSSISFKAGQTREMWLTGEAYFKVRTIAAPFLVHTSRLTVEVLGTAFDVRERRGKTEVVLDQGKVRVAFTGIALTDTNRHYPDVMMLPGQRIIWDDSMRSLEQSAATPGDFTDWKDGRLVLTNAALSDIITYVEDNYGQKIVLSDPHMAQRQIRGEILLDNLDDILFVLSKVLDVHVDRHGGHTIILRPN